MPFENLYKCFGKWKRRIDYEDNFILFSGTTKKDRRL